LNSGVDVQTYYYKLRYRESAVGDDGRTWRRYSTSFNLYSAHTVNSVYVMPKVSTVDYGGGVRINRYSYIDSPQLEVGSDMSTWKKTNNLEYVEPPFNPGGGIVFAG
jgi:hypothetical protein